MNDGLSIAQRTIRSREVFEQLIWPIWRERLEAVEFIPVEGEDSPLSIRTDFSGIDAFFVKRRGGTLIPIASRVEFARSNSRSVARGLDRRFTIRAEKASRNGWHTDTEYRRLIEAYSDPVSGRFMPWRTIHSLVWMNSEPFEVLFSSAVCTQALAKYVLALRAEGGISLKPTKAGDARFIDIYVRDLRNAGVEVTSIP